MENSQFDLVRLINTVFRPKDGERVGVFIDLEDPQAVRDARFLNGANHVTRRIAYEVFYRGLLERKAELPFASVEFYAYEPTGGSNLDLPATVVDLKGRTQRLVEDVLSHLNIVLCLSTYSATAPLTAFAKKMGFRGATMHGCNETILRTGLARNYEEVSAKAERFRQALTRCDDVVSSLKRWATNTSSPWSWAARRPRKVTAYAMFREKSPTFLRAKSTGCPPAPTASSR